LSIEEEKDEYDADQYETIVRASPFTPVFDNIFDQESNIQVSMTDVELEQNAFFCPTFIQFLKANYMSHCFIWASFTLQGIELEPITAEIEEQTNVEHSDITMLTHQYVIKTFSATRGNFSMTKLFIQYIINVLLFYFKRNGPNFSWQRH
jgi:hypothetical protein